MTSQTPAPHLFERAARRWSVREDGGALGTVLDDVATALQRDRSALDVLPNMAREAPAQPLAQDPSEPVAIGAHALQYLARRPRRARGRSRLEEEFRLIATQVLRAMSAQSGAQGDNIVMVTSATPGEGKTFFALNLAMTFVELAHRAVLLVDVDGRSRSLTNRLGIAGHDGLRDLQSGRAAGIGSALMTTGIAGLSVLPSGALRDGGETAPRPIARLIADIALDLPGRIVILDAPPCLSDSDPSALASVVGQTLLVVGAQETPRTTLEASLDLVQACPSIALVLNKVRVRTGYRFGDYQ